jgi:hypothetical protein
MPGRRNQGLMSAVNAVEISNRDRRAGQRAPERRGQILASTNDQHARQSTRASSDRSAGFFAVLSFSVSSVSAISRQPAARTYPWVS